HGAPTARPSRPLLFGAAAASVVGAIALVGARGRVDDDGSAMASRSVKPTAHVTASPVIGPSGEPGSRFAAGAEAVGRAVETRVVLGSDGGIEPTELRVPPSRQPVTRGARARKAAAVAPTSSALRVEETPQVELVPKDEF